MPLPSYFKPLFWFTPFDKITLDEHLDLILFQVLEKGRMEHLDYLEKKIGGKKLIEYAHRNVTRLSRKSILPFIETLYSSSSK